MQLFFKLFLFNLNNYWKQTSLTEKKNIHMHLVSNTFYTLNINILAQAYVA